MTTPIFVQDSRRAGLIGFVVSSVIVFYLLYYFSLNYTAMTTCPPNPTPGGCTNSPAGFFQIVLVLLIFPASFGWNFFRGKRFEFYEDSINIIGRMGTTLVVPYSELFLSS